MSEPRSYDWRTWTDTQIEQFIEHWAVYWADYQRSRLREELEVRDDYQHRAMTYGPVRTTEEWLEDPSGKRQRMITSSDLAWTLLGRAPVNVTPAWQKIIDETREIFAPVLIEQGTLF